MKKSLIAAAIAAVVAAPAAQAGVVIYGKVHVSIDYVDFGGPLYETTLHTDGRVIRGDRFGHDKAWFVNSRSSRLGFKGTEDLGNGLQAIWKYETTVNVSDGGNKGGTFGSARNSYIGLAGDWGTFLYGRHTTPYDIAFGNTGANDFADGSSIADLGVMVGFTTVRADNAIAYISPSFNGLTFATAIIPGENTSVGHSLGDAYSAAVMYKNNGLRFSLAYEDLEGNVKYEDLRKAGQLIPEDIPNKNSVTHKKWLAGIGYEINAFDFGLAYAHEDFEKNELGEFDLLGVRLGYSFGNNKLHLIYGRTKAKIDNQFFRTDKSFDSWALGFEHFFSKRTKFYAAYADSEWNLSTDQGGAHLSATHPDGGSLSEKGKSSCFASTNDKCKSFSLGLIHNF